jgi:hypothetical protein
MIVDRGVAFLSIPLVTSITRAVLIRNLIEKQIGFPSRQSSSEV